jgi:hypothetical protein
MTRLHEHKSEQISRPNLATGQALRQRKQASDRADH